MLLTFRGPENSKAEEPLIVKFVLTFTLFVIALTPVKGVVAWRKTNSGVAFGGGLIVNNPVPRAFLCPNARVPREIKSPPLQPLLLPDNTTVPEAPVARPRVK